MSIEVGSVLEGAVSGITKFGAFIDLPEGKTGLVHISEVAEAYVNDVNDFLRQGQKVKVKVLSVNDRGRIALSIKQAAPPSPAPNPAAPSAPRQGTVSPRPPRPAGGFHKGGGRFAPGPQSFEDKLSRFLKDSDERLTDLKRKTDSKRGGRGSRRSD